MLNTLQQFTWLTENTEVRTPEGWELVGNLILGDFVLGINDNKVIKGKIVSKSAFDFKGVIKQYSSPDIDKIPISLVAKSIHHSSMTWPKIQSLRQVDALEYDGRLFSFMTEHNQLLVRNFHSVAGYYHGSLNDYIVCQTVK